MRISYRSLVKCEEWRWVVVGDPGSTPPFIGYLNARAATRYAYKQPDRTRIWYLQECGVRSLLRDHEQ